MVGTYEPGRVVVGMEHGLGSVYSAVRSLGDDPRGHVPVFRQVLDIDAYAVAFGPGSETYHVLSNDQKQFQPPRSLPPILELELPEDSENPTGAYVITRYAYTEGAYSLLKGLLDRGHVFGMNDFLEFAWSLAKALAYLHGKGIVHGQWNDRSVVVIPTEERAHPFLEVPSYRFEVINTGVCFQTAESIPREYLDRGYYPPEVFVSSEDAPDYGALDLSGDVHCFAAFLKDLMQRACSTEELPSQASRILEELHKEANRRGFKAAPDRLHDKELEILDHLYTVKVRSESLIQEGLRPREERCSAARLVELISDLHEKTTSYLKQLFARGFEPVNVFGDNLQHYTTFNLTVAPLRLNSYEDGVVELSGSGLPHDFVRVTLDERHQGVRVLSAQSGQIKFRVEHGFPTGTYRISINNRRTNGSLEIYSPKFLALDPVEVHQPWEGFGNFGLRVRGERLPAVVVYGLRAIENEEPDEEGEILAIVTETRAGIVESTAATQRVSQEEEEIKLTFPCDTPPGEYELFANGLSTRLRVRVLEQLPEPIIREGALAPVEIKNHRVWSLQLTGRNFHPRMVVDLGERQLADSDDLELRVKSPTEAELIVPSRFPPGHYQLRLNYRPVDVYLRVVEPAWQAVRPAKLKLLRRREEPAVVELEGESLPVLDGEGGYALVAPNGDPIPGGIVDVEEVEPERRHRLHLSPGLSGGQPKIRFGSIDTGLQLKVKRQLPALAGLGIAAALLLSLAAVTFVAGRQFAPTIHGVHPSAIFAFGSTDVEVEGAYLDAVELVTSDGRVGARLQAESLPDRDGTYRVSLAGVPEGDYALRPIGPLFGAAASDVRMRVQPVGLRIEPVRINRLEGSKLRIHSVTGFDVHRLKTLELLRDDGGTLAALPLENGMAEIRPGRFSASDHGKYRLAAEGVAFGKGVELEIVGPMIKTLVPNPVTPGPNGAVSLAIDGSGLGRDLWIGLVPAGEVDDSSPLPLERTSDNKLRARVAPGSYHIVLGPDVSNLEALQGRTLLVLPPPRVVAVSPQRLMPNRETRVTIEGTNLQALERIVLQPEEASLERIEIALDGARVRKKGDLEGSYDFGVRLQSGIYRIQPSTGALALEVFDDCRKAVDAFRVSSDPKPLLDCLRKGRPSEEIRREAADLLFDRGLFAEARKLHGEGLGDLKSRFRASFVDTFVLKKSIPLMELEEKERSTPYGIAALLLGWAGLRKVQFPDTATLPWELEFVRAETDRDPRTRVAAYKASIAEKTAACRGFEINEFAPALDGLARAKLDLAVSLLRKLRIAESQALLESDLIGNPKLWARLSPAAQARSLFWHGHLLLWYRGETAAASGAFARAARLEGDAASHSRLYLDALAKEPLATAKEAPQSGWVSAFLRVYRHYREITQSPNYNLLTERHDQSVYLPPHDRETSLELHRHLRELESLAPIDSFAHYALLHAVRNAQRIAWPNQDAEGRALEHRKKFLALDVAEGLQPLKQFYLLLGDLGPHTLSQRTALSRSERKKRVQRAEAVAKMPLPEALRAAAQRLRKKYTGPSLAWWREK